MTRIPTIAFAIALVALIALAGSAAAAGTSPEAVAARLQQRYDSLRTLTFQFYQDTRGEMTGKARQGSGRAYFFKDGGTARMRWDYFSPDRQVLLSDGVTFSMYFEELSQLIVTPAEALEADLTYGFFSGRGRLLDDFHVHSPDRDYQADTDGQFAIIKLIPKIPQSQVSDIHVWVTQESLIRRLTIKDHFGTITVLNLSDIETDSLVALSAPEIAALFSFTPPPGTEIIRQ